MSMQVSDRSYATTETFDSRLTALRLGVVRAINPITSVALNLEKSKNEFDAEQPESYKFEIATVEYRKELASGEAVASLGRGRIRIAGDSEPTTVARLAWNRAVGVRSRLEICAGRELTDAGNVFSAGGSSVGCQGELSGLADVSRTTDGRLQGVVLSSSPLRRESVGLRFDVNGQITTFSASVGMAKDRFETDLDSDNDSTSLFIYGSRRLGQQWRADFSILRWEQNLSRRNVDSEDRSVHVGLARTLPRSMYVAFSLEHNQRLSDVDPFDENVAYLSFGRNFGR